MMKKLLLAIMLSGLLPCAMAAQDKIHNNSVMETEKKSIGNKLALYPMPLTVVGANAEGKPNWLLVAHLGVIGHDRILVSMNKSHYTNQWILKSGKLSINLVSREILPLADYVGSVSGASVDKSAVFDYHWGENGTPVITEHL